MSTLVQSIISSGSRPITLRQRTDLVARRHLYQGEPFWAIKDPVGLKYARLHEEEYFLLSLLDGQICLDELKRRYDTEYSPQRITQEELQSYLGMLHKQGLVISDAEQQGWRLHQRSQEQRWKRTLGMFTNIFAVRWRGIDPNQMLDRLLPYTQWIFHRRTVSCVVLMAICAMCLVVVNYGEFVARMPSFRAFFGPGNWLFLALTMGVVKVLHEFGHGLACKRFGGECHEMGFMLLVFTPALYCNVSDSWMLPNKWRRAGIGAAGMYVEIALASLATFAWWASDPGGAFNMLCLQIMFVCSVSTLMFNGNPLLRFDGYYIFADVIEIPNLRQKSGDIIRRFFFGFCLGAELRDDRYLPKKNLLLLGAFAIASYIYRWIVVFSILMLVSSVLEPYGLKNLARLFGLVAIFGMITQPLKPVYRFFSQPGNRKQVKRPRLILTIAATLLLAVLFFATPVPHSIRAPLEVQPKNAAAVYVTRPGAIIKIHVRPGDRVKQGDLLIELENFEIRKQFAELEHRLRDLQASQAKALRQRFDDSDAGLQLASLEKRIATIEQAIEQQQRSLDALQIRAPQAGVVLPPPDRPMAPAGFAGADSLELPKWTGSPLDPHNEQARLEIGDFICAIGDDQVEAVMLIDQNDTPYVRAGQDASIQLSSMPGAVFTTKITEIAQIDLERAPASLTTQHGGDIATAVGAGNTARPLSARYQARAPLSNDEILQIGVRGRAKIHAPWRPLGPRLWRYLSRTFHFDL